MSTINAPVPLGDPKNQFRVDYIQDVASQQDFDYPPVSTSYRFLVFIPRSKIIVTTRYLDT